MSKPNKRKQAKQKARAESLRKKKAAPKASPKTPLEDNYLTERAMRRALLLREGVPFASEAEADAFLAQALGEDLAIDELALEQVEADPVEMAQELAFQALAWEETEDEGLEKKILRLSNQALELDPLCLDALTARLRVNAKLEIDLEEAAFVELLAMRAPFLERLTAKWGDDRSKIPEVSLRPYQRFLGTLLMEGPPLDRNQDCIELALESWKLGPNSGMTFLAVLTWLLAGQHVEDAKALLKILSTDEGVPADELDLFHWWQCWLAFQESDLAQARSLFALAVEAFPESDLYLFTTAESDPDLELDPVLFEENHATFGPLLEALVEDPEFLAFGRAIALPEQD